MSHSWCSETKFRFVSASEISCLKCLAMFFPVPMFFLKRRLLLWQRVPKALSVKADFRRELTISAVTALLHFQFSEPWFRSYTRQSLEDFHCIHQYLERIDHSTLGLVLGLVSENCPKWSTVRGISEAWVSAFHLFFLPSQLLNILSLFFL